MAPAENELTNRTIPAGLKKTLKSFGEDDVQLEQSVFPPQSLRSREVPQTERVVDLDETQSSQSDLMDADDERYALPISKPTSGVSATEDTGHKRAGDTIESQIHEASTQRSTQGQEAKRMQMGLRKMVRLSFT